MDAMACSISCHFPGHTYGECTAVLWSQAHFISDALAFKGREANGKTGSLECRLKVPLRNSVMKLAKGKSRSLTHRLCSLYSVCVCNLSVSLIHVDLKSWESQCICGTQPVNTQLKELSLKVMKHLYQRLREDARHEQSVSYCCAQPGQLLILPVLLDST